MSSNPFHPVDDGAFSSTSKGPWSATAHKKLKADLIAVAKTRLPSTTVPFTEAIRVCPIMPASLPPLSLYLPPGEAWRTITVEVTFETCEYPSESNGTAAVYLYATCATADGWTDYPPTLDPTDTDGDGFTDSGWRVVEKGDSGTVELTARTWGRVEDIDVLVWVQVAVRDTAEDSGDAGPDYGPDLIEITTGYALALTNSPERAISFSEQVNSNRPAKGYAQLCWIASSGGSTYAYTEPPRHHFGDWRSSSGSWSIHEIGVLPITSLRATADAPEVLPIPSDRALHSGVEVAEQWLVISSALETYRRGRVPTIGGGPLEAEAGRLLPILSPSATWSAGPGGLEALDGSGDPKWTILDRRLMAHPTADSNGYSASVALAILTDFYDGVLHGLELELRLSVYTATDDFAAAVTPQISGTSAFIRYDEIEAKRVRAEEMFGMSPFYRPMAHTLARTIEFGPAWQLRGMLMMIDTWHERAGSDMDSLIRKTVEIPEEYVSPYYPCVLALEVNPSRDADAMTFGVVAGTIRNRRLTASG